MVEWLARYLKAMWEKKTLYESIILIPNNIRLLLIRQKKLYKV